MTLKTVDRSVLLFKPKQKYVDWANEFLPDERRLSLSQLRTDCLVVLVGECCEGSFKPAFRHVDAMIPDLIATMCEEFTENTSLWPKIDDFEQLVEWFDVQVHSLVLDSLSGTINKTGDSIG